MNARYVLLCASAAVPALLPVAGCHHREAAPTPASASTSAAPTLQPAKEFTESFPSPSAGSESTPSQAVGADLVAVYFDFDKSELRPDDRRRLNENAKWLTAHPTDRILIEGNCDERGTVAYNLALGERRARSARQYLIDLGIDPSRVQIVSYGKERPADPGHDEAAWSKNRRDDFTKIVSDSVAEKE